MNYGIDAVTERKILALITALFPAVDIYLFGSRARGTHSPQSDIDIALKSSHPLDRHAIAELKRILAASDISYTIEIVDFTSVSDDMRNAIDKEGRLWQI